MRINQAFNQDTDEFKILMIDDDEIILEALIPILGKFGYKLTGMTNPFQAVERLKAESFDLLILDFIMDQINGDKVVQLIREFNHDLYILMLTGYKDITPPIDTIRALDIQGYCEKSDKFDQLLLLIESAVKTIKQRSTIQRFSNMLNLVLETVPKIYQLKPIEQIVDAISDSIFQIIKPQHFFILIDSLMRESSNDFDNYFKGFGRFDLALEDLPEVFTPQMMEFAGIARTENKTVHDRNGIFLPLVNAIQQSIGMIYIETPNGIIDVKILQILAFQASSSLNNAFLHRMVNARNEELKLTYDKMKTTFEETIDTLRRTVDAKDSHTCGHSDRVSAYAVILGRHLPDLSPNDLETLRIGGIFHDIGKIGTSDDILTSDKILTEEEFESLKKHPLTGSNILSALSIFDKVVPLVKYHHERFDGFGYPSGLKGEEIPYLARIITIADSFDAMTSNRAYRNKLNVELAIERLQCDSGSHFDPKLAEIFITAVKTGQIEIL